jgi:hypothetical protein
MDEPPIPRADNDPAETPARPPRRRWVRFVFATFSAIVLLVVFAPQILSWTSFRHELPRFRLPGFEEEIRVGRASLSWWGPIELWDIELDAPDGQPFVRIAHVLEDRSVWDLVTRPTEPFHIRLEKLQVNALMRADGSNVEDALKPVIGHPKRQRRERTVEVVDGTLRATDTATGRQVEWKNIALKAMTEPDGTTPNRLRLRAELADAPDADPLEADVVWSSASRKVDKSLGNWKVAIKAGDLPATALGPLLGRICPGLDLSGAFSADLRLNSGGGEDSSADEQFAGDCQLATRDLQVTWPERLGADHPTFESAWLHVKFASDKARCRVEKLVVISDVCRLDGSGQFPVASTAPVSEELHDKADPQDARFSMRGAVDLVALVHMLPETLPMRDGAELTDGKVTFELASLSQDERSGWTGRIESTHLAGEVAGERVEWDRPLALTFDLHEEQGRLQIDSLDCVSDFVHITGRGNSDGGHFEAGCDLSRLAERLGQFFDTASRQMRGKLTVVVDLSRDAEQCLVVDARADIENLLLRQHERRMVERRRGEIQPVQVEVPARPAPLLPGQVLDRRAMQARKKAERQADREARRLEKDARKAAEEIVMVPVEGWKTVWSEPRMTLAGQARYVHEQDLLELPRFEAVSDALHLTTRGRLTELSANRRLDLEGETSIDMARLVERFRETLGPHLQMTGKETRRLSIRGPLRSPEVATSPRPFVPQEMTGEASLGFQSADLFGLPAGTADMDLALAEGTVTLRPVQVAVSGGKLNLAAQALLNGGPVRIVVPAGTLIDNVELTDEVCDTWMKYIAPVLSQATRAEGRFSVDLDETRFAVADPAAADLSGRLTIARGQVLPGPLFSEIGGLVSNIVSAATGNSPRDFVGLDTPLVRLDQQEVKFKLKDRRMYHSPVEFKARELIIRTRGSVGTDQTLDLVAELSFSDQLLSRARFLSAYRDRPMVLPIQGTLRKPKLDPQVVGRLAAEFGQNAIQGIINRGLEGFLDRNK